MIPSTSSLGEPCRLPPRPVLLTCQRRPGPLACRRPYPQHCDPPRLASLVWRARRLSSCVALLPLLSTLTRCDRATWQVHGAPHAVRASFKNPLGSPLMESAVGAAPRLQRHVACRAHSLLVFTQATLRAGSMMPSEACLSPLRKPGTPQAAWSWSRGPSGAELPS